MYMRLLDSLLEQYMFVHIALVCIYESTEQTRHNALQSDNAMHTSSFHQPNVGLEMFLLFIHTHTTTA